MGCSAIALILAAGQAADRPFDPSVREGTRTFTFDQHLLVPVRVHLLRSDRVDALNSRLDRGDVDRLFRTVNRIWHGAGIAARVESVVEEEAVVPPGFDPARARARDHLDVRPPGSRAAAMLHVYYVHAFPINGAFLGDHTMFVRDTARLKPVRGGVDEPLPRVTAHELGHALRLKHRQDSINLMASGTTGWSLNNREIADARAWAVARDWILTPSAALERGHHAFLLTLPGRSPVKERARRALGR